MSSALAQMHAAHKARQARMGGVPLAPKIVAWPAGSSSIFAIALCQAWAFELRLRVVLAEFRERAKSEAAAKLTRGARVRAEIRRIADKHGVTPADIAGPSRLAALVRARQEVCYRLILMGLSYPQAGRRLGGRDHTTVLHGVRVHCRRHGLSFPARKA